MGTAPWRLRPIAYVTSDGGLVAPPPGRIVQPPKLPRAELPAAGATPAPKGQDADRALK